MNGSTKSTGLVGVMAALLLVAAPAWARMDTVTVATETINAAVVGGHITCPKGKWGDAYDIDINTLTDKMQAVDAQTFLDMVGDFEHQPDAKVSPKTTTKDPKTGELVEKITTTGPDDGFGGQLCMFGARYNKH